MVRLATRLSDHRSGRRTRPPHLLLRLLLLLRLTPRASPSFYPRYSDIAWEKALAKELVPPIKPQTAGNDDTSQFEKYPDSAEGSTQKIDDRDQKLFEDF